MLQPAQSCELHTPRRRLIQPYDHTISDHHVSKPDKLVGNGVRNSNLLDHAVEEVVQEALQRFGESVVEAGREEVLVDSEVVSTAVGGNGAGFAAVGEVHD